MKIFGLFWLAQRSSYYLDVRYFILQAVLAPILENHRFHQCKNRSGAVWFFAKFISEKCERCRWILWTPKKMNIEIDFFGSKVMQRKEKKSSHTRCISTLKLRRKKMKWIVHENRNASINNKGWISIGNFERCSKTMNSTERHWKRLI